MAIFSYRPPDAVLRARQASAAAAAAAEAAGVSGGSKTKEATEPKKRGTKKGKKAAPAVEAAPSPWAMVQDELGRPLLWNSATGQAYSPGEPYIPRPPQLVAPRPPPQPAAFSVPYGPPPVQVGQDSAPWPPFLIPVMPTHPAATGAVGEGAGNKEKKKEKKTSMAGPTLTVGALLWEKCKDQATEEIVWVHSVTKQRLHRDPYV